MKACAVGLTQELKEVPGHWIPWCWEATAESGLVEDRGSWLRVVHEMNPVILEAINRRSVATGKSDPVSARWRDNDLFVAVSVGLQKASLEICRSSLENRSSCEQI